MPMAPRGRRAFGHTPLRLGLHLQFAALISAAQRMPEMGRLPAKCTVPPNEPGTDSCVRELHTSRQWWAG